VHDTSITERYSSYASESLDNDYWDSYTNLNQMRMLLSSLLVYKDLEGHTGLGERENMGVID
jgi:hypothetical protein